MKRVLLLSASALVMLACFPLASVSAAERIQDMQGNSRSVDEYTGKGKWVVLMIWASDCHICNQEAPTLTSFHERHKDNDAIMLGLALDGWDNREDAADFIRRHGVTFDNLIIDPWEGMELYSRLTGRQWIGTPSFLVYSPDGRLLAQQVGAIETDIIEDFMARHQAVRQN